MTATSLSTSTSSLITFITVDSYCSHFIDVRKFFREVITPIYGPQDKMLEKIGLGSDRLCEVMLDASEAKGLIVFKKALASDEQLELKTLSLLNPRSDSGKGLGSLLLERVKAIAIERFASGIVVTVSQKKQDSLKFFRDKHHFIQSKRMLDKYEKGVIEYELYLPRDRFFPFPLIQNPAPKVYSMPHHQCSLRDIYIRAIASRAKTFEGRIFSGPFTRYKIGDEVTWFSSSNSVHTRITDLRRFNTFDEMVSEVGYRNLVPEAQSEQAAVGLYLSIPSYSDRAKKFGVVAFKLEVIPPSSRPLLSLPIPERMKRERSE